MTCCAVHRPQTKERHRGGKRRGLSRVGVKGTGPAQSRPGRPGWSGHAVRRRGLVSPRAVEPSGYGRMGRHDEVPTSTSGTSAITRSLDLRTKVCENHTVAAVETLTELGERIREARLAHGLSQGDLARRLGLDRSALVRVEGGERKVTALELIRLSEVLSVPVAHFVYRSPLAITSRRESIEDDPQLSERARFQLDAILEAHLRDAGALRDWGYICRKEDLPTRRVSSEEDARDFARATRVYIDHTRGALPSIADVAEACGLYLLVVDKDVEGASLTPEVGFGVAVLGGRAEPGRRRFTAAHEIGHHLLGDAYHSDAGVGSSRDERERQIDVFASELLLPLDDVKGRWAALPGDDAWERLVSLAGDYRTSWAVAVRTARVSGVLSPEESRQLQARTPQRGDFVALLGTAPVEDLSVGSTGARWRQAVLRAYRDGMITKPRAVEMLHGALAEDELPTVSETAV